VKIDINLTIFTLRDAKFDIMFHVFLLILLFSNSFLIIFLFYHYQKRQIFSFFVSY